MHDIVREAAWSIAYHEHGLDRAHANIATVRALTRRTGLDLTDQQAAEAYDDCTEEEDCTTPNQLMAYLLGRALHMLGYHEDKLRNAHSKLAKAKALMRRANIEIPVDDILRQQQQQLEQRNAA